MKRVLIFVFKFVIFLLIVQISFLFMSSEYFYEDDSLVLGQKQRS